VCVSKRERERKGEKDKLRFGTRVGWVVSVVTTVRDRGCVCVCERERESEEK